MNVFYQEVLLTAEPDRGIPFTAVLFLLTHYNVIVDSRSLRLEEFLRRRARLQRVDETIRRNTVVGFFDTLHWSRKFRQAVNRRRYSRLASPPALAVPEIYIEDPDDHIDESSSGTEPRDFTSSTPAYGVRKPSPNLPPIDTSVQYRDSLRSPASLNYDQSPLSSPIRATRLASVDTSYPGPARSSPTTPTLGHSRHGSNVSGSNTLGVMESFDGSAWGESIRRSFTTTRPSRESR